MPEAILKSRPVPQPDPLVRVGINLDTLVAHQLRRAHQRASAIFLSLLGEHQLTPTQFFAMARLYELGQLSQNRLGRLAAMDPATIQGVIQRLAERGYIQRLPDTTDRRRMVLRLTEAGRAVTEALVDGAIEVDDTLLKPLTPEEQAAFLKLLHKIT